jgi:hypothetical protein
MTIDEMRELAKTQSAKFKKGDEVWVFAIHSNPSTEISVRHVKLESLGKRQGTALTTDGEFMKHRIYTDGGRYLFATFAEALAAVKEHALEVAAESITRLLAIHREWLDERRFTAKQNVVERAERELAELEATTASFHFFFHTDADRVRAEREASVTFARREESKTDIGTWAIVE